MARGLAPVAAGTGLRGRHALRIMARRAAVLAALLIGVSAAPSAAAPAELIISGPRSSGAVALTFDDGWGRAECSSIANVLRANDATATFFINGVHIKAQPSKWREILKGMPVANHTRTHPDLIDQKSNEVRQQIKTNQDIHEKVLGRPMLKLMRPPYGSSDARVRRIAGDLGYVGTVLWSQSSADTSPASTVRSIIKRMIGAPPGSILLMHCGPEATARALPSIISHYMSRGIRLVGLDTLLGM